MWATCGQESQAMANWFIKTKIKIHFNFKPKKLKGGINGRSYLRFKESKSRR